MNRLKQVRLSKGLNQKELAEALNLSQAAISGYETGKYDPGMKIWKMIADYFDIKKENPTGVPDEVYKVAKEFMELPPDAQAEARSYLAFLRQRYTRQDG